MQTPAKRISLLSWDQDDKQNLVLSLSFCTSHCVCDSRCHVLFRLLLQGQQFLEYTMYSVVVTIMVLASVETSFKHESVLNKESDDRTNK